MAGDSRSAMVRSAAALIGAQGLNAATFSEVLAASGAPRGSIYHHFPRGKQQLAEDAIEWTSQQILSHLAACPATTAHGVLDWFFELWRQVAVACQGAGGCAVAGVTIDTPVHSPLLGCARSAFGAWTSALAERLEATGLAPDRSAPLALAAVAAMEGALVVCRAEGSAEPLLVVAAELLLLV